jgi:hypothetical protein
MVVPAGPAPSGGGETGHGSAAREAEIGDLEFLVGNACSRVINLLTAPERDRAALREEMAFLSEKAGRLAELLGEGD